MDTLPEEMLLEIMKYLRYSDLKYFRLVCKKFYEASLAFCIVNRESFLYGTNPYYAGNPILPAKYNFDNFMKILSATERNFYHFHFVHTGITAGFCEFVERRADDILSLKFEQCDIMYDPMRFCKSINECIELKSLKLHELSCSLVWNRAATISLPALETMDISGIPDDMFDLLMDTNVKNLHLRVNYDHLNRVICTRGRLEDLKCVDLLDICTDAQLMNIADKLNLTSIHIDCYALTDECFQYFVEKQRRLQIVHIYNSAFITDGSLVAIAKNLKDLKELIIDVPSGNIKCSFRALNQIINLTPVRCIHVGGSVYVSGLVTTVGDVPVEKCLRQLHMWGVHNETHVTYIAENFLSLTQLTLMESDGVTNETLQLICQNLDELCDVLLLLLDVHVNGSDIVFKFFRILNVSNKLNLDITSKFAVSFMNALCAPKNLKKLILTHCDCIVENDVPRLTFSANFNNLEKLNLTGNQWLSDSILETCFKLSSLRILNVSYCQGLTVKSFVAMPKNFPCLEKLNMDILQVDYNVLLSTVSLMKRLHELNIGVSGPITDHLLNLLYVRSDSLHSMRFNTDTSHGLLIRSLERKTFVKSSEWFFD